MTEVGDLLDFKSKFYNLQGVHINERKKNFHKLLKSTPASIDPNQIDLQPRNYQENIFYVDVLIHFKNVDKLMGVLKEGAGILVSKILKQQWFFEEAFKNMSEYEIVNNFLPTLCFPIRMKVMKKLSLVLNEERMDHIFDFLLDRYGLFVAKQFLFSCSSEKIINILQNNSVILLTEQLKRLMQKDVNLLKVYFDEYKKNTLKEYEDQDFLNYLAWKRPDLVFEFGLNSKGFLKLGRYTTKALLKTNKDDIAKDIKNGSWNPAAITRELKDFSEQYLHLFLPDNLRDLNYFHNVRKIKTLLRKYPTKKRWQLLSRAFKDAYNCEIEENLRDFHEDIVEIFSVEARRKWAELKYTETDDLRYLNYYDSKKAFELLKDKINLTSASFQRNRMVLDLVQICHENNDYTVYEDVLKYIYNRHRNEDEYNRAQLISHISRNINYDLLTKNHWVYINKLINMQQVRNENLNFEIIIEYLIYLYKKELPMHDAVAQYMKDCIKSDRSFAFDNNLKNPGAESTVLKMILEILPSVEYNKKMLSEFVGEIVQFNERVLDKKNEDVAKYCIDLNQFPIVVEAFKGIPLKNEACDLVDCEILGNLLLYDYLYSEIPLKVISQDNLLNLLKEMSRDENKHCILSEAIRDIIKKRRRTDFENTLMTYFFEEIKNGRYGSFEIQTAIEHFLENEPEVIAKYFDDILTRDLGSNLINYRTVRLYSHLNLDEKMISYYKEFVSINSKSEAKSDLFKALSIIMKTDAFMDLIEDYIPDSKKLDLDNPKQKELYKIQCDLAGAFKNLSDAALVAPVLMNFCQGDYLQSSLPTLYKTLNRLSEERVSFYVNILGNRAMSTRKHAVFLALQLLSFKDAMAVYSALSNKETNVSAKKYLFEAVLKYFVKNPGESLLNVVFANMNFVNKNDTETIQRLADSVDKIPHNYVPLFIEKVWDYLYILEKEQVKVGEYRRVLLSNTSKYDASFFSKLDDGFCEALINNHFLKSLDIQDVVGQFIINYLLAHSDENHFKTIFEVVRCHKNLYWEKSDKKKLTYLFDFFNEAYKKFYSNDGFFELFSRAWRNVFTNEECFSEYISLELMKIFKKNTNAEMFASSVSKFFQEVIQEYSPFVGEFLLESVNYFYDNAYNDCSNFNRERFVYYLLKSDTNDVNCFIACNIIRHLNDDNNKELKKIIGILNNVNSKPVKVFINKLFKKY